jgi:hypothetical protein
MSLLDVLSQSFLVSVVTKQYSEQVIVIWSLLMGGGAYLCVAMFDSLFAYLIILVGFFRNFSVYFLRYFFVFFAISLIIVRQISCRKFYNNSSIICKMVEFHEIINIKPARQISDKKKVPLITSMSVSSTCLASLITKAAKRQDLGLVIGLSDSLESFCRILTPLLSGVILTRMGDTFVPTIVAAILIGLWVYVWKNRTSFANVEKEQVKPA